MLKSRYSLLFSIAGAVLTWWWRHRSNSASTAPAFHRGDTIYRNTPLPSDAEGLSGGPT